MLRIRIEGCDGDDDDRIVMAIALAANAAARAGQLAARMSDIAMREAGSCLLASTIGEVARASETIEHLLLHDPGGDVRLGLFLDRFIGLRAIIAGAGLFRLSVSDLPLDFPSARAVAFIVCDLIAVVEKIECHSGLDVKIAVEREEDRLLIAVAAGGAAASPVCTMAGSVALRRAERLIYSIGGSFARGVRDGEMLFGVGLPVVDG